MGVTGSLFMKEIRAYIQPFMLPRVTQTLLKIPGFPGMNVSEREGFDGSAAEMVLPLIPQKNALKYLHLTNW